MTKLPDADVDAATKEKLRTARDIGEGAFAENTAILRRLALRGFRALSVAALGIFAFSVVLKRKKQSDDARRDDSPTERYFKEMRGLGFDVDGLEEEITKRGK